MAYITKVDKRSIYGDGIGNVELWDFSRANQNEESRTEAVATVASICYGKPAKDHAKLVEMLKTESNGGMSSAFEFVRWGYALRMDQSLRNRPEALFNRAWDDEIIEHKARIATFRLKVPIFVARQVMRHRSFSYQELSRRYTDNECAPFQFWAPRQEYKQAYNYAITQFMALTRDGVPLEQARAVLGTGLYTEFWMQGDILAWKNYFALRLDQHTQKEHREVAEAMLAMLCLHQPELYAEVVPGCLCSKTDV